MITTTTPRSWWRSPPLILFLATVALYAITIGFDFQIDWDDDIYVLENEFIRDISFQNIAAVFTGYFMGNYAPVHILSYMVDHALWGLNPAGYHLGNVLLHALNGVLFYYLLRRMALTEREATVASWIFLAHPVQVETVAWISQRKNLLAMTFFLLALLGYVLYRHNGKLLPYLLAASSMTMAALSKSITVIFPLIVLLYDLSVPQSRQRRRMARILDLLPFILIAAATALMAMISQSLDNGGGRRQYHGDSPAATILTMIPVVISYLKDCLWPFGLSPSYDIPVRNGVDAAVLAALCLLGLVFWGGVWLYRQQQKLFFWYALFFVALVPVLQIVPLITLKNDRYLYFPLLGFAVLAAQLAACALRFCDYRKAAWGRYLLYGALVLLPLLTFRQSIHWHNDLTLWRHAVNVDPLDRKAAARLITSYTRRGDKESAVAVSNSYQLEFYRRQKSSRH